jgi:hypothetical protein
MRSGCLVMQRPQCFAIMGPTYNMTEQISANEGADLEWACFELARTTMWGPKPIDSEEVRSLAAHFLEIAKSCIFISDNVWIDAPLITRAIHYLRQAHGMPRDEDVTGWFLGTLTALLEVARPNTGLDERGQEFLKDMREGIDSVLNMSKPAQRPSSRGQLST